MVSKDSCWSHNVIPCLLKEAQVSGQFTNHSPWATTGTRLIDARVDEQLIMLQTGHSSAIGVHSYKCVTDQLYEKTSTILNAQDTVKCNSTSEQLKPFTPQSTATRFTDQKENFKPESTMCNLLLHQPPVPKWSLY